MDVILDSSDSQYIIRAYDKKKGEIQINHEIIDHHVMVSREKLIYPWQAEDFSSLANLMPVIEIVLIGTGKNFKILPPEFLRIFYQKNIGVEIMDTAAACRTFNLLASEKRNVAAGLMLV